MWQQGRAEELNRNLFSYKGWNFHDAYMILLKPCFDTILYFIFLSFSLDKEKILPSKQEKYLSNEEPVPAVNSLILAPSLSPTLNKESFFFFFPS